MIIFRILSIALALTISAGGFALAQSKIALNGLWQVQGTPLGTERALDPYLALTESRLFIGGSIEVDGNRRQVIQTFDGQTGGYQFTIEDPTGAVFAGLGDQIVANEKFMVTTTFRGASAGAGSLQVFDAETGKHLRTIENPRAEDSTFFGQLPIAISGNKIMAGVALSEDNQSTVWIFDLKTGEMVLTIDEPDNEGGLFSKAERTIFGFDKALTPTHALIGARNKSLDDMRNVGAAYLFDAASGELLYTFRPENPAPDTLFGTSVVLSETTVFVESLRSVGPLNWPSAEISAYDLKTGALKYSLQDPFAPQTTEDFVDGQQGSGFGFDFIVSEGLLYVGMPEFTLKDKSKVGGIQIFDAETGERLVNFENRNGTANDKFGYALVGLGNRIGIVSTPEVAPFRSVTRFVMYKVER